MTDVGSPIVDGERRGNAPDDRLGRDFWTLVASSGASNLADGIYKIALPLLALGYTRSPVLVAGVEIARSAPWLVLALQAGALADRWDRRVTMLVANALRATAVTIPAVLALTGDGTLWALYVAAVIAGVAEVFHDTASQSILPQIVGRGRLERANSRLYAVELGSQQFVAPPLGGALVGIAAVTALWVPSALWALAVVALWTVQGSYRPVRSASDQGASIRQDVAEGIAFLRGHRMLRVMAVMVGGMNLLFSALLPLFVLFAVGPGSALGLTEGQFGLLSLALAVGSLLASVVAERVIARVGRAAAMTATIVLSVLALAGPAVTTSVPVLAVLLALGGFGIMLWNIPTVSFRQTVSPDHMLGRVNSVYRLLAWGTMPIGAALGGLLAEVLPLRTVFAVLTGLGLLLLLPNLVVTDERLAAAEREAAAERDAAAGREAAAGHDSA